MFFHQNFIQTYMPCRRQSLKYCHCNYISWKGRRLGFKVQSFFDIFLCNTILQLVTTSRIITAAITWYHFVFKVNFEESLLQPIFFKCSRIRSIQYRRSPRFSFNAVLMNIFRENSYKNINDGDLIQQLWAFYMRFVINDFLWISQKLPRTAFSNNPSYFIRFFHKNLSSNF